jgi:predicted NUDIX family NTP pyrophosphohydrolase
MASWVLLAHPGGPYFKNKDEGAWSIPKGEVEPDEDLLDTAKREFPPEDAREIRSMGCSLRPVNRLKCSKQLCQRSANGVLLQG